VSKITRCSEDSLGWKNKATHGIVVTHGIIPHGTIPNQNAGAV
jgi:hypothetical protein